MPTDARRRLALGAIIMVLAATTAIVTPTPTAHADHCELIGCWRECRPVPGGVWCRRRCQRRCWRAPEPVYEPPAYDPQPERQYRPRSYVRVPRAPLNLEPILVLMGAFGLLGALFVAAVAADSAATDELNSETEETERQTAEARMLIAEADAKAREIDAHIDRFLSDKRR